MFTTPIQNNESNSVDFQKQMDFFNTKLEKLGNSSEEFIALATFNFPGSPFYYQKQYNGALFVELESIKIHKDVIKNLKDKGLTLYASGYDCVVNTKFVRFGIIYNSNFFDIQSMNRCNQLILSHYSLANYYDRGYYVTKIG